MINVMPPGKTNRGFGLRAGEHGGANLADQNGLEIEEKIETAIQRTTGHSVERPELVVCRTIAS
jgi:hypothetical protein